MAWFALRSLGERPGIRNRDERRERSGVRRDQTDRTGRRHRRLLCERLEERALMASPGYDYVLTGYSWSNPAHITYSIAPDGVFWDHGTNVLNATFNAKFGASGAWQAQIARALATWESVANINLVPVADGSYDQNALGQWQGDPRFGDIRIGGYSFLNNTTTLADTYFPPPNGSTAAGDVAVNTSMDLNINATYDLYSVLLHEFGHSLGLNHPPNPAEVMYATYQGIRTGLAAGDIAGIQAIYGARPLDSYQQQGLGLGFAAPIDVTSGLEASNQTGVSSVGLQSVGSTEYFSFVAPSYAAGNIQVTAAAANISMLSPQVSIYDAAGKLLAQAGNPAAWSDNVTATAQGVVPGERYYITVSGATHDVFSVGAYALAVSLPNGSPTTTSPPPTFPPSPPTPVPPPVNSITGVAPDRFEPNGAPGTATRLGRIATATVSGLNFTSVSDLDYFIFQTGATGAYQVSAPGALIQVFTARGKLLVGGANQVSLSAVRVGTSFLLRTSPPSAAAVPGYTLSINHASALRAGRKTPRRAHLSVGTGGIANSGNHGPAPGGSARISTPLVSIGCTAVHGIAISRLARRHAMPSNSSLPLPLIQPGPRPVWRTVIGRERRRPGGLTPGRN